MHRRTRKTLWILAAVLLLLAAAVYLRSKAPPEAARLLPESDGIIFINFKPIRSLLRKGLEPPQRVPDYQQFVDATGVDWERDLDGAVAYSLVLVGNLTGKRFNAWLDAHAMERESYAGHTIYSITSENRTVRVAQIGYDMVAVSNYPTPEMIHSMLDRHRTAALPFSGSTLLTEHYHEVPILAISWGVGQIALPFSESGSIHVLGFSLPLADDSTIVASVSPSLGLGGSLGIGGSLHIRVEEIAATDALAASQSASLTTLIGLARNFSAPLSANSANDALHQLLQTAVVSERRNRVVITAAIAPERLGAATTK
jgi:hypothetical protein